MCALEKGIGIYIYMQGMALSVWGRMSMMGTNNNNNKYNNNYKSNINNK